MKPLPHILKYGFLNAEHRYPMIVKAKLDDASIEKLLVVLRKHRDVMGSVLMISRVLDPPMVM